MDIHVCFPRMGCIQTTSCGSLQAVSVSLPTWDDIVRYMADDEELHGKLQSNYPRHDEMRLFDM